MKIYPRVRRDVPSTIWALVAAIAVASPRVAAVFAQPAPTPQQSVDVPKIEYSRFVLANGMVVLLHEDHSSPIVAVELWYHVGSKDDTPGKTGLAHMFEHMMFKGSKNLAPEEHVRIIQSVGGYTNASTSEDRTNYYERVPSHFLETALWLEAERMAFLPAQPDSIFELERGAVRNEYAKDYEASSAFGRLGFEALAATVFPGGSPYSVTPLGLMPDLNSATVQDLRKFFDRYYVPNNATLSLAGDFNSAEARALVTKYFSGIPRRAAVTHSTSPNGPLDKESRIVLEDQTAATTALMIAWRGAMASSEDRVPLVALIALLTSGANSRLSRALSTTATVNAYNGHYDLESAGIFQIAVRPRGNATLTTIEQTIDSVLASVRDNGVNADELRRWTASFAVSAVTRLESDSAKGALLNEGETLHHDPLALLNDIESARKLTPADIQRVAKKYLVPGRAVLSIVPAGKLESISKPGEPYTNMTRKKRTP